MNPTQRKIAETCKEFIPCFVNEEMYKKFVNAIADIYEEEAKQPADDGGLRDKFNKTLFLKKAGVQK